jgi:hypothetical protein
LDKKAGGMIGIIEDKTISAVLNINLLAGKKFITLMTAQEYKIGDSKPVIEFREH